MNIPSVACAVAAALTLTSCASHKVVTPNGHHRIPVNSAASLSRYQDLIGREQAIALEKSELERRVDSLTVQLAALKAYLYSTQKAGEASAEQPSAVPPAALPPARDGSVAAPTAAAAGRVLVLGSDKVLFRVNHSVGEMEFSPSAALSDVLLKAAREAKSISIRGRTDADAISEEETRIALGRAVHARDYLVNNGVDASKIRTWYRAAGAFIADNSTPEGRALNRRVEIEARGLDTSALIAVPSDVRVGRNP